MIPSCLWDDSKAEPVELLEDAQECLELMAAPHVQL